MTTPELPPPKVADTILDIACKNVDLRREVITLTQRIAEAEEQRNQWAGLCVRLEARIAELEADRDSWKEQAETRVEDWAKEYERSKAAEARIAELEADAARYQHLLDECYACPPQAPKESVYLISTVSAADWRAATSAAIDAAREAD